jgi:hypothetical protein
MFTLKVVVLTMALHHPVERRLWVTFPTRFTCEHMKGVIARDFRQAKITSECVRTNDRI